MTTTQPEPHNGLAIAFYAIRRVWPLLSEEHRAMHINDINRLREDLERSNLRHEMQYPQHPQQEDAV